MFYWNNLNRFWFAENIYLELTANRKASDRKIMALLFDSNIQCGLFSSNIFKIGNYYLFLQKNTNFNLILMTIDLFSTYTKPIKTYCRILSVKLCLVFTSKPENNKNKVLVRLSHSSIEGLIIGIINLRMNPKIFFYDFSIIFW